MSRSGSDIKRDVEALLEAFPTRTDLERLVRYSLDRHLEAIAGSGPLEDVTFLLVTWADSHGQLDHLLAGARSLRPFNAADLYETSNGRVFSGLRWAIGLLDGRTDNRAALAHDLLAYFWRYPNAPHGHVSWAAKESAALLGELDRARRSPGLGIAIVSTELAVNVFGSRSDGQIAACLQWAMGQTDPDPPHLVMAEQREEITSQLVRREDLRHTIALGIILARCKRSPSRLRTYLRVVSERQRPDGGWEPGTGSTVSEVFTAIYAVELLDLATRDGNSTADERALYQERRNTGIDWLIDNRTPDTMWASGVFSYSWDTPWTTSWLLHRLGSIWEQTPERWRGALAEALRVVVQRASSESLWQSIEDSQRFRVEARLAAAVARGLRCMAMSVETRELASLYLEGWKARTAVNLRPNAGFERGLDTVSLLIDALFEPAELVSIASAAGL